MKHAAFCRRAGRRAARMAGRSRGSSCGLGEQTRIWVGARPKLRKSATAAAVGIDTSLLPIRRCGSRRRRSRLEEARRVAPQLRPDLLAVLCGAEAALAAARQNVNCLISRIVSLLNVGELLAGGATFGLEGNVRGPEFHRIVRETVGKRAGG